MKKVKYIITRFNQMKQNYIGETSCLYTLFLWIDYALAFLVQGASVSDYFAYGFYKLRFSGRNEFITYRKFFRIQRVCNNPQDIEICRDKMRFNNYFSDLLGREWLDLNNSTYEEFVDFTQQHRIFFLKEVLSFRGIGIRKIDSGNITLDTFYNELKADSSAHYIVEEPISEINEIVSFHPWSINTIRIVTLYDTKTDKVHIMNARIRMGNKKNHVDNFHFDGIGANIDIASGVINTIGYDVHNQIYVFHPETGKQIIGFQIPYWKECIDFINKAARRLPSVRYIGWDVVIQPDGTFALIEANDNADHDFQQLHNRGLWKEYKKIIKDF